MRTSVALLPGLLLAFQPAYGDQADFLELPKEVQSSINARIENGYAVGIVVGLVNPKGSRYFSFGKSKLKDGKDLDKNSVFDIGMGSGAFTSLLLLDMVERGEVNLNDPIEKFLPQGVRGPKRDGRSITLFDLATHQSGLPVFPANIKNPRSHNPLALYSKQMLYEFISNYELTMDIGEEAMASYLGVGLLAQLLALRADQDFEALLEERITGPLGLPDTRNTLNSSMKERRALGHNEGQAIAHQDFGSLAGGMGLRSTAKDLLTFISQNLGLEKSPLAESMVAAHEPQAMSQRPGQSSGMNWVIIQFKDPIVFLVDQTGGYGFFAGFVRETQQGVVILTNSMHQVTDIGLHLLYPNSPLMRVAKTVKVNKTILHQYEGTYQVPGFGPFFVSVVDEHLVTEIPMIGFTRMYAESDNTFFVKQVDMKITFRTDADGLSSGAIVVVYGIPIQASKVIRPKISVSQNVLRSYLGDYEITPGKILTISMDNSKLSAQLEGEQKFQIFAESETDFYYEVVPAHISFRKNKNNQVTGAHISYKGQEAIAKKIR